MKKYIRTPGMYRSLEYPPCNTRRFEVPDHLQLVDFCFMSTASIIFIR